MGHRALLNAIQISSPHYKRYEKSSPAPVGRASIKALGCMLGLCVRPPLRNQEHESTLREQKSMLRDMTAKSEAVPQQWPNSSDASLTELILLLLCLDP